MLEDLATLPRAAHPEPAAVERLLQSRGVRYVTLADWKLIDALEVAAGASQNRPRVKMTRIADMLAALTDHVRAGAD
jgi:ferredoxin--NADP+ reductase